jgi:hypothetical protein
MLGMTGPKPDDPGVGVFSRYAMTPPHKRTLPQICFRAMLMFAVRRRVILTVEKLCSIIEKPHMRCYANLHDWR